MAEVRDSVSIFDPPSAGMRHRVTGGVVVVLISQSIKLGVQTISILGLSRLLSPSDFGVVAMAGPIVMFIGLLQELGLNQAVVQRPLLTQSLASAVFWMNAAAGVLVSLVLLAAAPLAAWFYGDQRVGYFLLASAVLSPLGSVSSHYMALLNRSMAFNKIAVVECCSALGGLAISIAVAILYPSFWALYVSSLFMVTSSALAAMVVTRWRPSRPAGDPELRKVAGFGAGLTGFNLANFFARNLDNVLIGKVWGGEAVGLYDRAYKLLLFPLQQINNPLARVIIPALSRFTDEPERYRQAYIRAVRLMALVTVPGVVFMVMSANWLVPAALGAQWKDATPIFQCLALAGLTQPFNNPTGWLFITQGRTHQMARWGAFSACTCAIAFVAGLPWGPKGVALAYALSEALIRTPILWSYVGREGAVRAGDLFKLFMPFGVSAVTSGLAVFLVCGVETTFQLRSLAAAPVGLGVFWATIALFPAGRAGLAELLMLVRENLGRLTSRFRAPRVA